MLNSALGANLPVDGLVSSDLREALREFQRQQGLPVSGFVGPDTIDALKQTSGSEPAGELAGEEFDISENMVRSLDERLQRSSLHLTRRIVNTVPEIPGLYRITWQGGSYYGKSETNLRKRLRQHINEVEQLGFSVAKTHMFNYAQIPRPDSADVKTAEKKVTALHFNEPGNTNKRIGELEVLDF
jgi:peptidoglycan hydrolase-like protein with peptidoglycan-binding domain